MPRPAQIDYDTSGEVRERLIRRLKDLRGAPLRARAGLPGPTRWRLSGGASGEERLAGGSRTC